ncbi:hypothetical protein EVAR_73304_1 [Eumeta japonica]|uniref:Uncharacterized protein n=1 Tax=Eumeta variegata TaxID=151549 RepID=A0A4C1SP69_EUMVA|nr:hypothetical protein EVAR_73304_1 [Eumeta japonica]
MTCGLIAAKLKINIAQPPVQKVAHNLLMKRKAVRAGLNVRQASSGNCIKKAQVDCFQHPCRMVCGTKKRAIINRFVDDQTLVVVTSIVETWVEARWKLYTR